MGAIRLSVSAEETQSGHLHVSRKGTLRLRDVLCSPTGHFMEVPEDHHALVPGEEQLSLLGPTCWASRHDGYYCKTHTHTDTHTHALTQKNTP